MSNKSTSCKIMRVSNGYLVMFGEPPVKVKVYKENEWKNIIEDVSEYLDVRVVQFPRSK